MPPSGKISASEFPRFRLDFIETRRHLPDVSDFEARRCLMQKLLPFLADEVARRQIKKNKNSPVVSCNPGMLGVDVEDLKKIVETLVHWTPQTVVAKGDNVFWITFNSESLAQQFLLFNNRTLEGENVPMQIRRVEILFTVDEIFQVVEDFLDTRDQFELERGGREGKNFEISGEGPSKSSSVPVNEQRSGTPPRTLWNPSTNQMGNWGMGKGQARFLTYDKDYDRSRITCWTCGEQGHSFRDCPTAGRKDEYPTESQPSAKGNGKGFSKNGNNFGKANGENSERGSGKSFPKGGGKSYGKGNNFGGRGGKGNPNPKNEGNQGGASQEEKGKTPVKSEQVGSQAAVSSNTQ